MRSSMHGSHAGIGAYATTAASASSSSQAFCLKLNSHQSHMCDSFQKLYNEETMTDCTISCSGGTIKAHKLVLSACSPYFTSLFSSFTNPYQYPILVIKDMPFHDLKAIIEFMYRGEVTVPQAILPSVLDSAKSLSITGLSDIKIASFDSGTSPAAASPAAVPHALNTSRIRGQHHLSDSNSHRSKVQTASANNTATTRTSGKRNRRSAGLRSRKLAVKAGRDSESDEAMLSEEGGGGTGAGDDESFDSDSGAQHVSKHLRQEENEEQENEKVTEGAVVDVTGVTAATGEAKDGTGDEDNGSGDAAASALADYLRANDTTTDGNEVTGQQVTHDSDAKADDGHQEAQQTHDSVLTSATTPMAEHKVLRQDLTAHKLQEEDELEDEEDDDDDDEDGTVAMELADAVVDPSLQANDDEEEEEENEELMQETDGTTVAIPIASTSSSSTSRSPASSSGQRLTPSASLKQDLRNARIAKLQAQTGGLSGRKMWSDDEVRSLVRIWEEESGRVWASAGKKLLSLSRIADLLQSAGIDRDISQVEGKIKALKRDYKAVKSDKAIASVQSRMAPFLEKMDRIFTRDADA